MPEVLIITPESLPFVTAAKGLSDGLQKFEDPRHRRMARVAGEQTGVQVELALARIAWLNSG